MIYPKGFPMYLTPMLHKIMFQNKNFIILLMIFLQIYFENILTDFQNQTNIQSKKKKNKQTIQESAKIHRFLAKK